MQLANDMAVMIQSHSATDDPRKLSRETLLLAVRLKREGSAGWRVTARNLSAGGMMVHGCPDLVVDDVVVAEIPGIGRVSGVIAWTHDDRAGMAFDAPVDPARAKRPTLKSV